MSSDNLAQALRRIRDNSYDGGAVLAASEALAAHEAEKQAGPVAEHCPFKRCQDQGAHCNGACHGLMPDGKTPLAAVPELRDDVDEGRCLSCAGEFCTAGPFCVACSNPVAPPSPLAEQDKEDAELTDEELLRIWDRYSHMSPPGERRLTCMRAAIRAARAKKEQP